jgi:heat-inducible transcriptional repressor
VIPRDVTTDLAGRLLTDRERAILRAIVHLYVLHASPVGSRMLARYLERELPLSAASIRNSMADLEELGLITHPHTSAGRMPTDRGYRLYVDSLMEHEDLPVDATTAVSTLLQTPRESLLREASRVLGVVSNYLAIVRLPAVRNVRIRRVELIPLSSERLLVVLALESDIVRTMTIETPMVPRDERLEDIRRLLNERLAGKPLRDVSLMFPDVAPDDSSPGNALVRLFVDHAGKLDGLDNGGTDTIHVAGTPRLLTHPEFVDPERMRSIIELVEDQEAIVHLLEDPTADGGVRVRIGNELAHTDLHDYSLIATTYRLGNVQGTVGLIGPKRMPYGKLISLVEFVSGIISNGYDRRTGDS